MTKPIFGWFPDVESEMSVKPNVNSTKFGDSYEARVATGINSMPQKWSLTFSRDRTTILAALAFLKARAGVESFTWTSPHQEEGTYVCREWKTRQKRGVMELTCNFEQVFEY
jgi:phage-related protein